MTQPYASRFGNIASIASFFNKGFVIGEHVRLTRKKSFENILIAGPTGSGKTSHLLIKNIVALKDCSMIINDPSHEIYQKTSGYLQQFFTVQTLNFSNSATSAGYNPLARITTLSDINKLADLLIRSTLDKNSSNDPFWSLQSKSLLVLCIRLVRYQAKEYQNFANVLHIVNTLASNESKVEQWMVDTRDDSLILEYKSFISIPEKTRLNIVASTRASLEMFSDPEIANVTAHDSIDFASLRTNSTVLFIHNSISSMKYLNVLIGIFFDQCYGSLIETLPSKNEKDIFIVLEEASSLYVPILPIALANTRKFRVGTIVCVQSPSQLQTLYKEEAQNITAQCMTKMYLPGHTSIDMMRELELLSGMTTYTNASGIERTRPLITISEIRELKNGKSLILSSNLPFIISNTSPYYTSWLYKHRTTMSPMHQKRTMHFETIRLLGNN